VPRRWPELRARGPARAPNRGRRYETFANVVTAACVGFGVAFGFGGASSAQSEVEVLGDDRHDASRASTPATERGWHRVYPELPDDTPGPGVEIYAPDTNPPDGWLRVVIVLHGWDHRTDVWRDHVDVAALANRYGWLIVAPETGRSVFERALYGRRMWSSMAAVPWVLEIVLPWVDARYPTNTDVGSAAVVGYSTGGRGAAILGGLDARFGFVGSVSGTFDLMTLEPGTGEYRIHAAVFGERDGEADRWYSEDVRAVDTQDGLARPRWVIAHGAQDVVVPSTQSIAFAAWLEARGARVSLRIDEDAAHDWAYWAPELLYVLNELGGAQESDARRAE